MYIAHKHSVSGEGGASFADVLDAFDHAKKLGAGAQVTTYCGVKLGDIVTRPPPMRDDTSVKLRIPEVW